MCVRARALASFLFLVHYIRGLIFCFFSYLHVSELTLSLSLMLLSLSIKVFEFELSLSLSLSLTFALWSGGLYLYQFEAHFVTEWLMHKHENR